MSGRLSNPFIHTAVTLRPTLPSPPTLANSSLTVFLLPHRHRRLSRIRCFFAIRRGAESHRHADFVLVTHRSPLSSTVFTPPERCSRCSPAACSGSDTEIYCFSPCLHTEIGNKSSYQADIFDKSQRERGNGCPYVEKSTIFEMKTPFSHRLTPFPPFFAVFHRKSWIFLTETPRFSIISERNTLRICRVHTEYT